MSDHKEGRIFRPPRTGKFRSYLKANQPSTKEFKPADEIVAVPKTPEGGKDNKTPSEG